MSTDPKRDLLSRTGPLEIPREVINHASEGQAQIMLLITEQKRESFESNKIIFGKLDALNSSVGDLTMQVKIANGRTGKNEEDIKVLKSAESVRHDKDVFVDGSNYWPKLLLSILHSKVTWIMAGAVGGWLLHHFKFIQ